MVIGCHLGSAFNPVMEGLGGDSAKLRAPVGNLINRLVGCAIALLLLTPIAPGLATIDDDPARLAALFHLASDFGLAALLIDGCPRSPAC